MAIAARRQLPGGGEHDRPVRFIVHTHIPPGRHVVSRPPDGRPTFLAAHGRLLSRNDGTAVALLAECGQSGVLAAAVEVLGDPDEGVRWTAAIALARRVGQVAEVLLRWLAGCALEPELRHTAAYVLREIADAAVRRRALPFVVALDRSDYRVAVPLAADAALRTLRPRDAGGKTAGGAS